MAIQRHIGVDEGLSGRSPIRVDDDGRFLPLQSEIQQSAPHSHEGRGDSLVDDCAL